MKKYTCHDLNIERCTVVEASSPQMAAEKAAEAFMVKDDFSMDEQAIAVNGTIYLVAVESVPVFHSRVAKRPSENRKWELRDYDRWVKCLESLTDDGEVQP